MRRQQVSAQLVRDGNIGGILSRTTAAGATFYDYDGNGNVTLLTDSNGNDVGHYRYDAFGNTLEATGPRAAENPYRFSTKEIHDGATSVKARGSTKGCPRLALTAAIGRVAKRTQQ